MWHGLTYGTLPVVALVRGFCPVDRQSGILHVNRLDRLGALDRVDRVVLLSILDRFIRLDPVGSFGRIPMLSHVIEIAPGDHEGRAAVARSSAGGVASSQLWRTSSNGLSRSAAYSRGMPNTRSLMMLRWISLLPPPRLFP